MLEVLFNNQPIKLGIGQDITLNAGDTIVMPQQIAIGNMMRSNNDLLVTTDQGEQIRLKDFFSKGDLTLSIGDKTITPNTLAKTLSFELSTQEQAQDPHVYYIAPNSVVDFKHKLLIDESDYEAIKSNNNLVLIKKEGDDEQKITIKNYYEYLNHEHENVSDTNHSTPLEQKFYHLAKNDFSFNTNQIIKNPVFHEPKIIYLKTIELGDDLLVINTSFSIIANSIEFFASPNRSFTEGVSGPQTIFLYNNAKLTDTLPFDYGEGSLTISITGQVAGETLSLASANIASQGAVRREGDNVQVYENGWQTIGTIIQSGVGGALTIDFNQQANVDDITLVINQLTYTSQDYNPLATRQINLSINDGETSVSQSFAINVTSVANNLTLTNATDYFVTGEQNDIIHLTRLTYNTSDFVNTGSGTDTLSISGGGTLTLNDNLQNLETVLLDGHAYDITLGTINQLSLINATALNNTQQLNLNTVNFANSLIIQAGAANDNISLSDANLSTGFQIAGGLGTDTLSIIDTANISANELTHINSIERIILAANNNQLTLDDRFVNSSDTDSIEISFGNNTLGLNISAVDSNRNVIIDGTGSVTLTAASRVLSKSAVNTNITGSAGNDIFIGNSGNDQFTGLQGVDTFTGGLGADQYHYVQITDSGIGEGNRDVITDFSGFGGGGDQLSITDLAAVILFNDDQGFIGNGQASAFYSHSNGNTILQIDSNGDQVANSEIQLTGIININSNDVIASTITLEGTIGNDTLNGTAGDDNILALAGDDIVNGDAGDDMISGNAGNDTLTGGANNDLILGGSGNDILIGGTGSDTLIGSAGNDILISDNNSFDINNFASRSVWLNADNSNGDGSVLRNQTDISAWQDLSGSHHDTFDNTAGTTDDRPEYQASLSQFNGRRALYFDGNDNLYLPTSSALGIQNSDYEIFIVNYSASSNIQFLISSTSIEDYEIHLNGGGGARYIPDGFVAGDFQDIGNEDEYTSDGNAHIYNAYVDNEVGNINVDNTASVNPPANNARSAADANLALGTRISFGNFLPLTGSYGEVLIFNDHLSAQQRQEVNEYLAFKYDLTVNNITLGVDTLTGGSGADIFRWTNASHSGTGSGNRDSITDFSGSTGEGDTIDISAVATAIIFNVDQGFIGNGYASSYYSQVGGNTILNIDLGGDSQVDMEIELIGLHNLTDSDVTSAPATETGTAGNDNLVGTNGADIIYGGEGDDTISGGESNDILKGDAGNDQLSGGTGDDLLMGNANNDTLIGGIGNDTIIGGAGDDIIIGDNASFDINSFASRAVWLDADNVNGDGSVVRNQTEVSAWQDLSGNNHDTFDNTGGTTNDRPDYQSSLSQFNGRRSLYFDGDDNLFLPTSSTLGIQNSDYEFFIVNYSASNSIQFLISSTSFEDYEIHLNGGPGARYIPDGFLPDSFQDIGTNDGYTSDGNAHIYNAYVENDLGELIVDNVTSPDAQAINARSAADANIVLGTRAGNGNTLSLTGNYSEILIFNDNLTAAEREQVNQYLTLKYDLSINNITPGVDLLTGGSGADIFRWTNASHSGSGSGNRDIITDFSGSGGEGDTIDIAEIANKIVFNSDDGFVGNGFASSYYSQGGGLTIINIDLGGDGLSDMEIELTGTINLTDDDVVALNATHAGTDGNDNVSGTANDDIFLGRDGDDTFTAGDGHDILQGHLGNDILTGDNGNDLLLGGEGDDILTGGAGIDTLQGGDGNDILILDINDFTADNSVDGGAGANDILRFDGTDQTIDFTAIDNDYFVNIEYIDLDPGNNILTLNELDVFAQGGTLFIQGDAGDTVNANITGDSSWIHQGSVVLDTITYNQYTLNSNTLNLEAAIGSITVS